MYDGGSIYNLSANPGTVIEDNYMYNNKQTQALELDEGSRYLTLSDNVVQDAGTWALANASATNYTSDNTFEGNWYNAGTAGVATGPPHENVLEGNVQVSGYDWPAGAEQVIGQAGIGTSGTAELHAIGAAKCLDVNASSTTPGTQLQIWDCNGGANQIFTATASGQLTVYSGANQMCLDAYGAAISPGTKVIIWPCNGQSNQQWSLNADGTVTGVQSGLCLDVTGASAADGALAELWTCDGGSNQQWRLS